MDLDLDLDGCRDRSCWVPIQDTCSEYCSSGYQRIYALVTCKEVRVCHRVVTALLVVVARVFLTGVLSIQMSVALPYK